VNSLHTKVKGKVKVFPVENIRAFRIAEA